jgi:hypothetical protein
MKNSKRLLVVGLIALLLAGGLVLASCGSDCPADGDCYTEAVEGGGVATSNCTTSSCAAVKAYEAEKAGKCDC